MGRSRQKDTRVYAPLEVYGSFSPNSRAEALLPFANLFAETCYEELVQEKCLLSATGCAWLGRHGTDSDLLQTSLLILYKNKVRGESPELRGMGGRGCTL